jgi:haloalkane dehalogenase
MNPTLSPAWLDVKEYPFASHYCTLNGQQVHYIMEGKADSPETFLFIHGTPSWSFDYRNVIRRISKSHRCIAYDHVGFGLSAKPARYDYGTQNHARTLATFVEQFNLTDLTLVVHDFGGPIGWDFALKHPERIRRVAIINSWLWDARSDPDYIRLAKVLKSPLLPFLYRYLNFSPRFLIPAAMGKHRLPKAIHRQYIRPFRNPSERYGMLAFARSLVNDQEWFESLWQQRARLADKPLALIWGMKDRFLTERYFDRWMTAFPHAEVLKLADCGHFPQEEQPQAVADFLLKWCG